MHLLKRILKFLLLVIPPLVLALPLPFPFFSREVSSGFQIREKQVVEEQGIPLLTTFKPLGSSAFSHLLGVQASPVSMPAYLCIDNNNSIFLDGEVKRSDQLLDEKEAGAMLFKTLYPNGDKLDDLYVARDKTECRDLPSNLREVHLSGEILFRHALPFEKPFVEKTEQGIVLRIPFHQESLIRYSDSRIRHGYHWIWKNYIINLAVFFIAWSIILSHMDWAYRFIAKPNKG